MKLLIITGPQGCGKTHLASSLARLIYDNLFRAVSAAKFIGEYNLHLLPKYSSAVQIIDGANDKQVMSLVAMCNDERCRGLHVILITQQNIRGTETDNLAFINLGR